jgi:hypothetical protein
MPVPSHQDIYYYPFLSMTFNLLTLTRSEYSGFSGNNKYLWTLYTGYFNFVFLFAYQICTTTCIPFILPGKDILNLTIENIYSLSNKRIIVIKQWLPFNKVWSNLIYMYRTKNPRKTHKIFNKFTINMNDFTMYEQHILLPNYPHKNCW